MLRGLLCFIFSCSFALAGPWEDFVQAHRKKDAGPGAWVLCAGGGLPAPASLQGDPVYQKLAAGGDWSLHALTADQAQDLQHTLGAQWALLTPAGDVAGAGPGQPRGQILLDVIHHVGAKARFELRETFLQEHPDQGEALQEALAQELRMLRAAVTSHNQQSKAGSGPVEAVAFGRLALGGAEGAAKAEDLFKGALGALQRLTRATHWTREAQWLATRLAQLDLGQAASGRRLFADLAPEVEARAAAEPGDAALLQLWMELLDGADQLPDTLAGKFTAVPGTVWPSATALFNLLDPFQRRRDWAGLQRLTADLTPQAPPEPLTPQGWEEYCELRGALLAHAAAAQASQGAWAEAWGALLEALRWAGPRPVQSTLMRRSLMDPQGDAGALRRLLLQAANQDTPRPPMPPSQPSLRLTLLGRAPWLLAWTALYDAPELALWSPGELRWDFAAPAAHAHARHSFGWNAHPRWVLYRGEEPLATGEDCPTPKGLAAILADHGTPMLERLARTLAQRPELLPARRARFELLLKRMPDPRLEPLLAEDAAQVRLPLPFGPGASWKPDEGLWGAAAQGVLPALEAELRSWPSATGLWEAWISWARFHPDRPSVVDLARSLPFWCPNGDFRTGLPYPVQRAVAAELRRQGLYLQMRDWFQGAWELLDHRPLKELRPWEREWLGERRREEETAIFQPLRDALRALGMAEQQLDLERTFGAMMGKDLSRSR